MDNFSWLIDAKGKIQVGLWGKTLIEFIVTYFQWLFDAIKLALNFLVDGTTAILLMLPPLALVIFKLMTA